MQTGSAARFHSSDSRLFFDKAPDALLAFEEGSLGITAANQRAANLFACGADDLQRRSLYDIFAPGDLDRVVGFLHGTEASGELHSCKLQGPAGAAREADLTIGRVPEEGIAIVAFHDPSARHALNEQLRQARKMEGLGLLAGGIAHDFNNLLTIISGYSQMLLASTQMTTERDRTALEQVIKASERAADLTSQLLAFSRHQTVQPRVLEINRAVDQTMTMLRRLISENIDLHVDRAPDAGRIHADSGQFQQLVMNLAINARDAMPQGGKLLIRTGNAELGADYIGQHLGVKPGSYVMIEVADTGSGMDEATRKQIFDPFFTTKPQGKGTGLGLSTVYGIIRQYAGSIDLYSEPGHGTTFRVYLPRVLDAADEEKATQPECRGGHETVLLVEDEEGVRKMVNAALERRGYRVLVASGGPEALAISRAHHGPIDLLLSDMIMPGMNGRELAERLHAERPATAVLFISGYAGNTLQNTGTLEREAAFLQKPFAPAVLTSRVRELLDARAPASESAARC